MDAAVPLTEGLGMRNVDWYALGRQVAMERARHGWTQQQLADRADVSQFTVSQTEQGKPRRMAAHVLISLAAALGVTIEYLLYEDVTFREYSHPPPRHPSS